MVKFICNRGFTHELVRHRTGCSYAQESTRYCNYTRDTFGNEITCIIPPWYYRNDVEDSSRIIWRKSMEKCEQHYFRLIELGLSPQDARGVLPIDIKTEIIIDANIRQWRHIFKMRTVSGAHPSMQQLLIPLLQECKEKIPILFDDIEVI